MRISIEIIERGVDSFDGVDEVVRAVLDDADGTTVVAVHRDMPSDAETTDSFESYDAASVVGMLDGNDSHETSISGSGPAGGLGGGNDAQDGVIAFEGATYDETVFWLHDAHEQGEAGEYEACFDECRVLASLAIIRLLLCATRLIYFRECTHDDSDNDLVGWSSNESAEIWEGRATYRTFGTVIHGAEEAL